MPARSLALTVSWRVVSLLMLSPVAKPADSAPIALPPVESSHATAGAVSQLQSFFTAKSAREVDRLNAHFSREQIIYIDATLGRAFSTYAAVSKGFADLMPQWPASARSYPTRIVGDERSALVAFTDTPELFGAEIRILAAVDWQDGKIIRWVDYWDGRNFGIARAAALRAPEYPADLGETAVASRAAPEMLAAAQRLARVLSGAGSAAEDLFAYDAVFEDVALRAQVLGSPAIARFLARAAAALPYGKRSTGPTHVVGNALGGGYEWRAPSGFAPGIKGGILALEIDKAGKIARVTAMWDAAPVEDRRLQAIQRLLLDR